MQVNRRPFPKRTRFVTNTAVALRANACYVGPHMKSKFLFALALLFSATAWAVEKTAYTLTPTTNDTVVIRFTNNFSRPNGVSTLEGLLGRKWVVLQNFFTTQNIGSVELPLPSGYSKYRLRSMSVVPGNAFPRLALAYGKISTVAGTGPASAGAGTNLWRPEYEGAIATNVPLSSPRAAVADDAGNIYVVEPSTHSVLVIARTNGRIYTAIGQLGERGGGNIGLPTGSPTYPATNPPPPDEFAFPVLHYPTGLFYSQGILYVLDSGNARVLKYRDGLVSKLFSEAGFGVLASLENGGSLWVSGEQPEPQEAFYTDGTVLKHWEAAKAENGVGGASIEAAGLVNLTDVKVNPQGRTIVVDQGANRLYRVRGNGSYREDIQAGNGLPRGLAVGDARRAAVPSPSSIAYLPIGGYFISSDAGARVWYVDIDGDIAPFIFGRAPTVKRPGAHAGDGFWFRRGGRAPKVSNVQSISVAPNGDLILLEGGYVRKIQFLRATP